MTPLREAIVLPAIFLTVVLCGGFRLAADVKLVPPSLTALVLAIPLIGLLVRSGTIPVTALLSGTRRPMENVSGGVVLATLFAASAQALNLLIPDTGLLHAAFAIFVFCQLLTLGAGRMERPAALRSLLVLFGSLFVLRYILVEALYASGGGMLHRVLVTLMSGASLGGIAYEPNAPLTGYVAFFTLLLYFVGLLLLTRPQTFALVRVSQESSLRPTLPAILILCLSGSSSCQRPAPQPSDGGTAAAPPSVATVPLVSPAQRAAALRSARVWQPPAAPIPQARLDLNPLDAGVLSETATVECRLVVKTMSGTPIRIMPYQIAPKRQRPMRASRSRTPARPSARKVVTNAAMSGAVTDEPVVARVEPWRYLSGNGSFWDVGVPMTSQRPGSQEGTAKHLAGRARQRYYAATTVPEAG